MGGINCGWQNRKNMGSVWGFFACVLVLVVVFSGCEDERVAYVPAQEDDYDVYTLVQEYEDEEAYAEEYPTTNYTTAELVLAAETLEEAVYIAVTSLDTVSSRTGRNVDVASIKVDVDTGDVGIFLNMLRIWTFNTARNNMFLDTRDILALLQARSDVETIVFSWSLPDTSGEMTGVMALMFERDTLDTVDFGAIGFSHRGMLDHASEYMIHPDLQVQ